MIGGTKFTDAHAPGIELAKEYKEHVEAAAEAVAAKE
jgi:hypothetical protein